MTEFRWFFNLEHHCARSKQQRKKIYLGLFFPLFLAKKVVFLHFFEKGKRWSFFYGALPFRLHAMIFFSKLFEASKPVLAALKCLSRRDGLREIPKSLSQGYTRPRWFLPFVHYQNDCFCTKSCFFIIHFNNNRQAGGRYFFCCLALTSNPRSQRVSISWSKQTILRQIRWLPST